MSIFEYLKNVFMEKEELIRHMLNMGDDELYMCIGKYYNNTRLSPNKLQAVSVFTDKFATYLLALFIPQYFIPSLAPAPWIKIKLFSWKKRLKEAGKQSFKNNKSLLQEKVCTSSTIQKYILDSNISINYELITQILTLISCIYTNLYAAIAASILIARSSLIKFCKTYQ